MGQRRDRPRRRPSSMTNSEKIAKAFHESYERLAPEHSYETRKASAKPWDEVPENNRKLMVAVVEDLLDRGIISQNGGS